MDSSSYTYWNIAFTALGAAVYWGKWGRTRLKAYILSDIVGLFPLKKRIRTAIEFLIFIALGCFVGIGVVSPSTPVQALTAGFAWTGLFASRSETTNKEQLAL